MGGPKRGPAQGCTLGLGLILTPPQSPPQAVNPYTLAGGQNDQPPPSGARQNAPEGIPIAISGTPGGLPLPPDPPKFAQEGQHRSRAGSVLTPGGNFEGPGARLPESGYLQMGAPFLILLSRPGPKWLMRCTTIASGCEGSVCTLCECYNII